MSATTMENNKRWKSHKGHSTHTRASIWEAEDSPHRDYDWPINSQKVIPKNYDGEDGDDDNEDNDEWNKKVKEGGILVVESG